MEAEMTLNEFMDLSTAFDEGNGYFSVEIILKNMQKSKIMVNECFDEFDAKERAFLFLLELVNKNK